jgi:hypothetical protein
LGEGPVDVLLLLGNRPVEHRFFGHSAVLLLLVVVGGIVVVAAAAAVVVVVGVVQSLEGNGKTHLYYCAWAIDLVVVDLALHNW